MSQTTSKTESLETYNFRDPYKFYQVGPVITINPQDESKLSHIFESLKKNQNIQILNIPKTIFHKSQFQNFFFTELYTLFYYFNIKQTRTNFVMTKDTISNAKYIVLPPTFFYIIEDAKKILLDLQSNKNLEYIYVETYLGSMDITRKLIDKLEYKIVHEKKTRTYTLFKISKRTTI